MVCYITSFHINTSTADCNQFVVCACVRALPLYWTRYERKVISIRSPDPAWSRPHPGDGAAQTIRGNDYKKETVDGERRIKHSTNLASFVDTSIEVRVR